VENVFDNENATSSPLLLLLCEDAFELRYIFIANGGFMLLFAFSSILSRSSKISWGSVDLPWGWPEINWLLSRRIELVSRRAGSYSSIMDWESRIKVWLTPPKPGMF
jgi:hypothetical protein